MSGNPVLREGTTKDGLLIKAFGGLNFLRGNKSPYFSLTGEIWEHGRVDVCGMIHDEILALWPELQPLADLHGSDMDGVPSYAAENGWYWAGGYRQWNKGGKNDPPSAFILARHLRIPEYSASEVSATMLMHGAMAELPPEEEPFLRPFMDEAGIRHFIIKAEFARFCDSLKPRWKQEAEKCIADLGLKVFGDGGWVPNTFELAVAP